MLITHYYFKIYIWADGLQPRIWFTSGQTIHVSKHISRLRMYPTSDESTYISSKQYIFTPAFAHDFSMRQMHYEDTPHVTLHKGHPVDDLKSKRHEKAWITHRKPVGLILCYEISRWWFPEQGSRSAVWTSRQPRAQQQGGRHYNDLPLGTASLIWRKPGRPNTGGYNSSNYISSGPFSLVKVASVYRSRLKEVSLGQKKKGWRSQTQRDVRHV